MPSVKSRFLPITIAVVSAVALSMVFWRLFLFVPSSPNMARRPGGKEIAFVSSSPAYATDASYTRVCLRPRPQSFAHCVFGGLNYGAKLSAAWLDSRDLLITCYDYARLGKGELWAKDMECRWRDVRIHYKFIGLSPLLHGSCPQ